MGIGTNAVRVMAWFIISMLMMPLDISAQDAPPSTGSARFSKEELTQMVAPIALYPDSLTAQILMAATYPLEIVEAERWQRQNSSLKGKDLDNALKKMNWDPSVASLCHFPNILYAMSSKLDQTRKLGDAFLRQEDEVMATIQELRRKAEKAGTLQSTEKQKVVYENEDVIIEPVDPEVIYVPVYDPLYVYGPWWYPAYPPYYWYYPPGFAYGAFIGFGPGIFLGFDLFSWCWFDWPVSSVQVDLARTNRFHRHDRRDFDDRFWRHNPYHRRGVAYRDRATSEVFGVRTQRALPLSPETRGFPQQQTVRQPQPSIDSRSRAVVPATQMRPQAPRSSIDRAERTVAPATRSREMAPRYPPRDTPFRGIGGGNFERRAGERGESSVRSSNIMRQSGGGPSRNENFQRGGSSGEMRGGSFRQRR